MRLTAVPSYSLVLLVTLIGTANADASQRGVVNGLAVTPDRAQTGTRITATVTGVNPCGAVFVDWGDGTAVTHPISELPTTQTHTYSAAGAYTVKARGMGNCDGEASAAVRIDAPPAPPIRRQLTAFAVSSPGVRGTPVNMTLDGQGACRVAVAFGDGNTQEFSVELPHTVTHVYGMPGAYNVTASAMPPCEGGRHTARLEVTSRPAAPRLTGLTVRPDRAARQGTAIIEVAGTGSCSYLLEYGDGNRERRTATLPDRVQHVYPPGGSFAVVATAEAPCEGKVQETLAADRPGAGIERLVVSPDPARTRSRVSLRIEGRGTCRVTVDFDDGNEQSIEGQLPLRIFHTYARPGRYEIWATTVSPCSGDARTLLQVRR